MKTGSNETFWTGLVPVTGNGKMPNNACARCVHVALCGGWVRMTGFGVVSFG